MNEVQTTKLIGNAEVREMLGMQSQAGLNSLRARDKTFPIPIKTNNVRQAKPRYDLAEVEAWIAEKKKEARKKISSAA